MPLAVTAIIVNYNAGEYIGRCIRSILASDLAISIIVVDNASDDGSVNHVMQMAAADSRIKTLINSSNKGFAAACNQGLRLVKTPYVCIVNPDCEVESSSMRLLAEALEQNSGASLAGGWISNPDGSTQRANWRRLPDARRSFLEFSRIASRVWKESGVDLSHRDKPSGIQVVEAVSGACMMIRLEHLQQLGGFDEAYFLHCEDLDLMQQIQRNEWQVLLVPDARIMHHQGVSSQRRPAWVERQKHRGMAHYYRKFHAGEASLITNSLVYAGIRVHLLGSLFKLKLGGRT